MLRAEPDFEPVVNRRRVLTGGVALAALAIAAPACSSPPAPPAVDELEAQLSLARQDSELATAAAVGADQQVSRALKQVAAERSQHAQALTTEIKRLAPTSVCDDESDHRPRRRPPRLPRRRWPPWSRRSRHRRTAPVSWRAPRRGIAPGCSGRSPRRAPRPTPSRWRSERPRRDLRRAVELPTPPPTRRSALRWPTSTPSSTATASCRRAARRR